MKYLQLKYDFLINEMELILIFRIFFFGAAYMNFPIRHPYNKKENHDKLQRNPI